MSIYQQFGVEPIINASGAVTRLGGGPMPPEAIAAFVDGAGAAVSIERLQGAACRIISEATGTEAGLVTAGCAAALTLGTAAILAGLDSARMERLPHCEGFPHEMVIAREQRSGYDHAVRAAGAKLVEVGFNEIVANAGVRRTEAWEYEAAFTANTAGVIYTFAPHAQPPLEEVVAIAHKHHLPVLVDAAGEIPPRANLKEIPATDADLVAFSGGKSICGPQSTGILCGKKQLVGSAALQMLDMDDHWDLWSPPEELIDKSKLRGMPRHGIGRSLKVSKEEIAALLVALRSFTSGAYDAQLVEFRQRLETVAAGLEGLPVQCRIVDSANAQTPAYLEIQLLPAAKHSALEVCRALRAGEPGIYLGHAQLSQQMLVVRPQCLFPGQAEMIAQRLREELER
jgi:L-seryl-tRNA(Ser) seleniumtransferase